MHRILITFGLGIICCCCLNSYAQEVKFLYDDAGNRIERYIYVSESAFSESAFSNRNKSAFIDGEYSEALRPITDQISQMEVKIYPNPTSGALRLDIAEVSKDVSGKIEVFATNGKKVYSKLQINQSNQIDLHDLANGIYILKLEVNNEVLEWKIIKQ